MANGTLLLSELKKSLSLRHLVPGFVLGILDVES